MTDNVRGFSERSRTPLPFTIASPDLAELREQHFRLQRQREAAPLLRSLLRSHLPNSFALPFALSSSLPTMIMSPRFTIQPQGLYGTASAEDAPPLLPSASSSSSSKARGVAAKNGSKGPAALVPGNFSALGAGRRAGCACEDCFENEARCPCVRLNGQRVPYEPVYQGEGGGAATVTGVALEQLAMGMTRTKVYECTAWCKSAK